MITGREFPKSADEFSKTVLKSCFQALEAAYPQLYDVRRIVPGGIIATDRVRRVANPTCCNANWIGLFRVFHEELTGARWVSAQARSWSWIRLSRFHAAVESSAMVRYCDSTVELLAEAEEINLRYQLDIMLSSKYKSADDLDNSYKDAKEAAMMTLSMLMDDAQEKALENQRWSNEFSRVSICTCSLSM